MDTERPEPSPAPTSDTRVDQAIAGLAALGDRPLDEHPRVLEAAHDRLREILGELGEPARPGRPGQPGLQGQLGQGQLRQGQFGPAVSPEDLRR